MASGLGSLVLKVATDTAEFQAGMTKAVYQAEQAAKRIESEFKALGATLATVFALDKIKDFVKEAVDAAAALDDLSEITGATVEGLSQLTQVAKIGGLEVGQVQTALVRLNKALSGTDDESKGAGKALDQLGLTFKELRGQAPDQALRAIANELVKFEDGAGKTSVAMALFGKTGAELLPLLKDIATTEGVVAQVTAEQASQAEAAQKAFNRFALETLNVKQALVRDLIPAMTNLLEQFTEGKKIAGGFFDAIRVAASINPFKSLADNMAQSRKQIQELQSERGKLSERGIDTSRLDSQIATETKRLDFLKLMQRQEALAAAGTGNEGERAFNPPKKLLTLVQPDAPAETGRDTTFDTFENRRRLAEELDKELASLAKREAEYVAALNATIDPIRQRAAALERTNETFGQTDAEVSRQIASQTEEAAVIAELNGAYRSQVEQLLQVAEAHRRLADASDTATINAALAATPTGQLEAARKEMTFFSDAMQRGAITAEQFSEIATTKLKLVADTGDDAFKLLSQQIRDWGNKSADAFIQFALTGKGTFADLVNSILADIARIQLKRALDPAINGASDWLGSAVSSFFGGSSGSVDASASGFSSWGTTAGTWAKGGAFSRFAKGSAFGNNIYAHPTMFRFAQGAGFGIGQLGEAGPEAVMPLARSSDGSLGVRTSGRSGGIVVNIHEAPGTRVKVTSNEDSNGLNIVAIVEQVNSVQSQQIAKGQGLARVMESRYGLSSTPGLRR